MSALLSALRAIVSAVVLIFAAAAAVELALDTYGLITGSELGQGLYVGGVAVMSLLILIGQAQEDGDDE